MREITSAEETVEICKALGSTVRLNLIKILSKNKQMYLNDLATQ
jgi:predicted transcriptional regulator